MHKYYKKIIQVIDIAGGEIRGENRFQKIAFMLSLAKYMDEFDFNQYNETPYSESFAKALENAKILNLIEEEVHYAEWGGRYSIFKTKQQNNEQQNNDQQNNDQQNNDQQNNEQQNNIHKYIKIMTSMDADEVYVVSQAIFLAKKNISTEPWKDAIKYMRFIDDRKVENAKKNYKELFALNAANIPNLCDS